MNSQLLTLAEVMDILKVSRRTLYTYIKEGKIEAFKVGDRWRVTEEALKKFLGQSQKA